MFARSALLTLAFTAAAAAQSINFNFDSNAPKAASKTELKLDGPALQIAKERIGKELKSFSEVDAVFINA